MIDGGATRLLAIAFVLLPWGWARVAILTLAAGLLGHRLARGVTLDRLSVALAGGTLFWIAHVASPYWLLAPSAPARIAALCGLVLLALGWACLAAREIDLRPRPIPAWAPMAVAATLAFLCAPGLGAPLEFRGDEDFHVGRVLAIVERVQAATAGRAWPAASLAVAVVAAALRPRLGVRIGLVILAAAPFAVAARFAFHPPAAALLEKLGRYPILSAWGHTVAMFSPAQLWPGFERLVYDEALYRLVPFGAVLVLAAWAVRVVPGEPARRAVAALALASSPLVLYYATALYLELPAVVLITIGLYTFDIAARRELRGRCDRTGSLLAISLGVLLKESTAPHALAIATVCGVWAVQRTPIPARCRRWAAIVTVVSLPLGVYLAWRMLSPAAHAARPVSFDVTALSVLGHSGLYELIVGALMGQLGPGLLLLAAAGASTAVRRRPRAAALWAFTAAGSLVFLAGMDVEVREGAWVPVYWGHSRFTLLVLPSVLCFALEAFRRQSRGARIVTAIALAAIASNILLRPIGWDGSRPPRWGDVIVETAGERYPYDALYGWASATHVKGEVRIIGRDYPYDDEFYIRRYGLDLTVTAPRARAARARDLRWDDGATVAMKELQEELQGEAARRDTASLVVVHVRASCDPGSLPERLGPRLRLRTFELGAHALVVYGPPGFRTGASEDPSTRRSPRS